MTSVFSKPGTIQTQYRRPSLNQYLPLILLIGISIFTLIAFSRPLVRGDGIAYLAWLDTLVLDRDVNLDNQHDLLREVNTYQIEWDDEQARWINIFPFGVAFVQGPFYLLGDAFQQNDWFQVNSDYFRQMQGVTFPYSFWLMVGAGVMALITVVLGYRLACRFCDPMTAALVAYGVFIGTPLFYYSTISPLHSHNPAAFTFAVFFYVLVRVTGAFDTDAAKNWGWWVLLGVFAALNVLTRWQLAVAAAPVWVLLAYERRWRGLGIATLAAMIAILPLPVIWQAMFGAPLLVPYDAVNQESFMEPRNHSFDVLRETIIHSPVIVLSLLGIAALWRTSHRWALLLAAIIAGQVLVNGSTLDWDAGDSYGMRRMSEIYIVYVVLAAALVGQIAQSRTARRLARGALLVLVAYNFYYIIAFMNFTWTNPNGDFKDTPAVMLTYFSEQPHRWQVFWEVYRTHTGPLAWTEPGP